MKIPKRIASAIINSLKGGVVPRIGLPYITVGRETEIDAFLHDIGIIEEGGASFRFIVGKYGSGKSFLLQTVRNYAMDKGLAVADADLSPERRLQGTKGQGLATYKELIRNLSVKTRPEGGALTLILDRWISGVQNEAMNENDLPFEDPRLKTATEKKISEVISSLNEMVHGFDFARLLTLYYRAYTECDDELKAKVVKWFRGEYATKTEAKAELGVNIIITDDDWYEYIKLFAAFLKRAGYGGLLILIDELVNIYKIPNGITRQYNYEKILTMYNDTLQGICRNTISSLCVIRSICLLAITISPLVTGSSPAMTFKSVDLPEPERPTMQQISPCSILRLTPRRAFTPTLPTLYTFVTLRMSIAGTASLFLMASIDASPPILPPRGVILTTAIIFHYNI